MASTQITYTDGKHEIVPITMRATCKAEAHAIEAGWGTITESPVRTGAYATYAALRMAAPCLISSIGWTPWRPSTSPSPPKTRMPRLKTLRISRVAARLARMALFPSGQPLRRHAMAMAQRGR